jgi:hypothetical protein
MRTFCVITTNANELVGDVHARMPMILPRRKRSISGQTAKLKTCAVASNAVGTGAQAGGSIFVSQHREPLSFPAMRPT